MFHGIFSCMHGILSCMLDIFLWTQVFIRSVGGRVFSRIGCPQEVENFNIPGRREQKDDSCCICLSERPRKLWRKTEFLICCFWHLVGVQKTSIFIRKNAFGYLLPSSEHFQQLQKPAICRNMVWVITSLLFVSKEWELWFSVINISRI